MSSRNVALLCHKGYSSTSPALSSDAEFENDLANDFLRRVFGRDNLVLLELLDNFFFFFFFFFVNRIYVSK